MKEKCFRKWGMVVQKIKNLKEKYKTVDTYYIRRLQLQVIIHLRQNRNQKINKLKKFQARRTWNMKKRVYEKVFNKLIMQNVISKKMKADDYRFQKIAKKVFKILRPAVPTQA